MHLTDVFRYLGEAEIEMLQFVKTTQPFVQHTFRKAIVILPRKNQIRDRAGQHLSASDEIKAILGIPSRYEVLCVVSLGHKAENKPPRTEREQNVQQRTHFERF